MVSPAEFELRAREMVQVQIRERGIHDERVLDAMLRVPRHEFVPAALLSAAYEDRPLPIGQAETISQPYIVAAMTEALQVMPGDRVLEVGTGSGYQAAILSRLGAEVFSIERNRRLADEARERLARLGYEHVQVIAGDGSEGLPHNAPYNAIVVTAAAPSVPQNLITQLADGGRLLIPVGEMRHQVLTLILKHGSQTLTRTLDPCQFVPLIGKGGWPEGLSRFG